MNLRTKYAMHRYLLNYLSGFRDDIEITKQTYKTISIRVERIDERIYNFIKYSSQRMFANNEIPHFDKCTSPFTTPGLSSEKAPKTNLNKHLTHNPSFRRTACTGKRHTRLHASS